MAKKEIRKYPGTELSLYSTSQTIFKSLADNLSAFYDYKTKYTTAFVDGLLAARKAAIDLPNTEAVDGDKSLIYTDLITLGDTCVNHFSYLKGYIDDAFKKADINSMVMAAGGVHYAKAANHNWEELTGLNNSMIKFIGNPTYASLLTTDGYMPAGFPAKIVADATAFDAQYSLYKSAKETAKHTAAKIAANNLLYNECMAICKDGRLVFKKNAALKKEFTYTQVLMLIAPPGSASLKIVVKQSGTNSPVAGATVTIQAKKGEPISAITSKEGIALFQSINPDAYLGKVTAQGHPTVNFSKDVNTGTDARKEIFL